MQSRPFGRLVRPLIAIGLTAIVLWRARPSAVLQVLAGTDLRWMGIAILLVVVDRTLMAYRWIVLLCPIDRASRPALGALIRLFFLSTFAGTFLPASIGGDVVRAYGLSQLRVAPGQALASVLMDRLLGVVSILIVGVAGLILARSGDLASTRAIELPIAIAGALSLAAASVVFNERAARLAEVFATRLPFEPIRRIAAELTRATRAYGHYHVQLANVLAGSIGVQVLRILQAYCLGRALMIAAPLGAYFTFIPLILLVMLLPISINGIGPSQVAFVWFFARVGVSEPAAFALSVLFVALGVVGNLPGGLLYAVGPRPHAKEPRSDAPDWRDTGTGGPAMSDTTTQYETVPCNVCGSLEHRVVLPALERQSNDFVSEFKSSADEPLTEQVVACARCGLQFVSPRLRQDLILDGYRAGSDERFVSQASARERTFAGSLRRVEKHIPRGRLLDIGTAAGSFMHVAETRGWTVSGCEPNRWMCDWGRTHYGLTIDAGTLFEQKYPDQAFDVVTLWDVLEHAGDPKRLLEECARVVRPHGLLVVNYPDVGSWIARIMQRRWVMFLSGHLYYFTRPTITDLLRRTGFEAIELRPHFQRLELQYLLLRAEPLAGSSARLLSRVASRFGLSGLQVPYWMGQTFVIARRRAAATERP